MCVRCPLWKSVITPRSSENWRTELFHCNKKWHQNAQTKNGTWTKVTWPIFSMISICAHSYMERKSTRSAISWFYHLTCTNNSFQYITLYGNRIQDLWSCLQRSKIKAKFVRYWRHIIICSCHVNTAIDLLLLTTAHSIVYTPVKMLPARLYKNLMKLVRNAGCW